MPRAQVYRTLGRLVDRLLPPRCVLCRGPGQRPALDLCGPCEADLPRVPVPCRRCGMPGPAGRATASCGRCAGVELVYERCIAPWVYDFPVADLVQALKYEGALANARVLGALLAREGVQDFARDDRPALVVAMPLHPSRLVERGFNQSLEIARAVSRELDLPLARGALERVRATQPQVGLARVARAGNVRGAFVANAALVGGRQVVLIDDVVTTGSTALEAAATLQAAGACRVEVWAAARALG